MAKPRTHEVERGKGVPKEREVNRRREVSEWVQWEGRVRAREAIGASCESLALHIKKNSHQRIGVFRLPKMLSDRCKSHELDMLEMFTFWGTDTCHVSPRSSEPSLSPSLLHTPHDCLRLFLICCRWTRVPPKKRV